MLVFFFSLPDPLGLSLLEMFSGKILWQVFMAFGGILVLSSLFTFAKKPRAFVLFFIFYFFLAIADYEVFRFSHQRLSYSFIRTYFHISNAFDSTTISTLGGDFLGTILWVGLLLAIIAAGTAVVIVFTLLKRRNPQKFSTLISTDKKIPISALILGTLLSITPLILFLTGTRGVIHIPVINASVDMRFTLGKHTLTSPILHIAAVETFEFIRDNEKITEELVNDLNAFLPQDKINLRDDAIEYPTYFGAPKHEYRAEQPYNIVFIFGESFKGRIFNQMLQGDTLLAPNLWKLASGGYYKTSEQDSSKKQGGGLWFKNTFSGGYPTVRGTMASYFGFPSHPNRDVPSFYASNHFKGFPEFLTNYKKAYVTVSNPVFDHTLPFVETFYGKNWSLIPEAKTIGTDDSLGVDLAIKTLSSMPTQTPWLLVYNTIATHIPFYNYPDSFASKPDDAMIRYRNAARYTDIQFGRFMDELSKRSDFDRTVVLIVGDHDTPVDSIDRKIPQPIGVSAAQVFMGIFSADSALFDSLTIRDDVASQLDIGPTILDLAMVREPNHFWGYDLLSQSRSTDQPALFFGENGYYLGFKDFVLTGGLKTEEIYKGTNYEFKAVNDSLAHYWKSRAVGASRVLRSTLRNDKMMK
ncbi:MAG: sulfatase-like hydrolase/transferase [Fibrobacter sp.]|nr:sulfatase-like hydrolase/transferase [Fibrobacter sp.]